MTRNGMSHAALLALAILSAGKGIVGGGYAMPDLRDSKPWRRKKWQKGPSAGPGGPIVRLTIPRRRKP